MSTRQLFSRTRLNRSVLRLTQLDERVLPSADFWQDLASLPASPTSAPAYLHPTSSRPISIDMTKLSAAVAAVPTEQSVSDGGTGLAIALPRPNGTIERFAINDVAIMDPALALKYPEIKTYRGAGIDDPTATIAMDITPQGFHVQVLSATEGSWYIDPYYNLENTVYISYYGRDLKLADVYETRDGQYTGGPSNAGVTLANDIASESGGDGAAGRGSGGGSGDSGAGGPAGARPSGTQLRTYRMALAGTGEYTQFYGGTVALGLAAIVTTLNRVDQVFENDFSIRMVLIANNDKLVYTDPATDPYTNNDPSKLLAENQANLDSVIGTANYDIGHVFTTNGGGLSALGSVGNSSRKAMAETGLPAPIGDGFAIDYVAHEIGHSYDANHSFNSDTGGCGGGNRNGSTAYEPGSASTIMSYAGLCGADDLQTNADPYFSSGSYDEVIGFVDDTIPTVGKRTPTGNAPPTVNAGANYVIPAQTPFVLTATGADANGDPLTYTWEERDLGPAKTIASADNGTSPLLRSLGATTDPSRTFPRLSNLVNNVSTDDEKLPTLSRTAMNFRVTVRDNNPGAGGVGTDEMSVKVINTGSPFRVTAPNTAVNWMGLSTQTVTWDVAGTTAAPINAANVTISLSIDGGLTYPITVLASTPNDGSEVITVPNFGTAKARIRVQGAGNIFFDISNANFTIVPIAAVTNVSSTTPDGTYGAGVTIPIVVTFAAPVNVTGSPTLSLNSGAGGVATYAGGSGTTTLTFNYAVQVGDFSFHLDYLAPTSLSLNGGTITDKGTGADAILTLAPPLAPGSLGGNNNIVIITVPNDPPTGVTAGGPYNISEGQSVTLNATATDPENDPLTFSWDLNGDGVFGDATGANPTLSWAMLQAMNLGDGPASRSIQVRVSDFFNPPVLSAVDSLTIDNVAPSATLSNGGSVAEGSNGSVGFSAASDPSIADSKAGFRYAFDFNGDGFWDIGDGTYKGSGTVASATVPGKYLSDGPSTATIRAAVIDKDNGVTIYTTSIPVTNVAPTATLTNSGPVAEGGAGTVSFTNPADVSSIDTQVGFRYAYDFNNDGKWDSGDGTYAGSSSNASASIPAALLVEGPSSFKVTAAIIDKNDGITTYTTTVQVANAAPTATLNSGGLFTVGSPASVTFTNQSDPSPGDAAAGFTYSYDFNNNGLYTDPGDFQNVPSPTASFAFQLPGTYTVAAQIIDRDGGVKTYTTSVTVVDVPPTAALVPLAPINEGSPGTVAIASVTHPSQIITSNGFRFSYDFNGDGIWDIGDGKTYNGSSTQPTVAIPAQFVDDGSFTKTVRVRVFDQFDKFTDVTQPLVLQNVAPTALVTVPPTPPQVRTPLSVIFTKQADPSQADSTAGFRYSLDVNNNGIFTDPGDVLDSTNPVVQSTFKQTGNYTVRARITDKDGGFTDYLVPVTIAPVTKQWYATGTDTGDTPVVRLFDQTGTLKFETAVFDPNSTSGARVAVGDVNGDGTPDLVAATGAGVTATMEVIDGKTGRVLAVTQPFGDFTGGLFVAVGDVDGDGKAEIAVSPDQGGGPRVTIYNLGATGLTSRANFFGINDVNFRGGARVALADLNGDGLADLIVSAGFGGGPRISGYDATSLFLNNRKKLFADFFAFDPGLRNGAYVAGGDVDGDGFADLVLGAGPGGGPQVLVLSGKDLIRGKYNVKANFFAGNIDSRAGVRVTVADLDGDFLSDIVTGPGLGSGSQVTLYPGSAIGLIGQPLDNASVDGLTTLNTGVFVG